MAQYQQMRRSLPTDILLLFRLGDFYEMFFDDAKEAASIINIALTKRNEIPMCGFPHHAAQAYIAKLVQAGKRVALAEQTSEPQPGKIVEREISQIISAGTVSDITLLDDKRPNYLAAVYQTRKKFGLACVDHSTGEFTLTEFLDLEQLSDELARIKPSELLVSDNQDETFAHLTQHLLYESYAFLEEQATQTLQDHFRVQSLDGFGCGGLSPSISAAGAIFHYLQHQLHRQCDHLRSLKVQRLDSCVLIDAASQQNLDLTDSLGGRSHSLVGVLDRTKTPMGARRLRDWILHPQREISTLLARQALIQAFLEQPFLLSKCQESLKKIRDIERTTGRLAQGGGNARDLRSLCASLQQIPALKEDLHSLPQNEFTELRSELLDNLLTFPELTEKLDEALVDEPPAKLQDGGILRDGYLPELDELRAASRDGKKWMASLQEEERKRTGIETLKIKFNNVFGYFIEVTKAKVSLVPEDYQRKQTTANAERFITPELKEVESKVLGADERAKKLELSAFTELRVHVAEQLDELQQSAQALASLDTILSLAEVAQQYGHTRPTLTEGNELNIEDGRHPVLEQTLVDEPFVPNDTFLNGEERKLTILTGPNMAGKSTYIRQVALLTIMAQIGAFIPARAATIGLVDRIFCRVGASDDLSKGQSTFMVEMNETALIVNNASQNSLVILDEIGRGTATFDGLSIAWSVAEHLHDQVGCRTIFATHYHELCDLAHTRKGVVNCNVAVREWNDEIIFLRKIQEGQADKSYGIQVAKLAGLPDSILSRAKDILTHLEMNSNRPEAQHQPKAKNTTSSLPNSPSPQMNLF